MTEVFKFKCKRCGVIYYNVCDKGDYISTNNLLPGYFNRDDKWDCGECNPNIQFSLKHDKFSQTDIELIRYISKNFYNTVELSEENERLRNEIEELQKDFQEQTEKNEENDNIIKELQRQIEGLQVAHEALLDTFRGYSK